MNRRYVMLIDLQACTGCNTCTIACKQENNLPEGVLWTQVVTVGSNEQDSPAGIYPQLRLDYLPLACQHCAEGPCVEVCPTEATYREPETGVVMQDPSSCIGCRYCMLVCPFTGIRVFADQRLQFSLPYRTGDSPLAHRAKTVEKCTFCEHRLNQGLMPSCVDACPLNARIFGDLNDSSSEVCNLLRTRAHFQLLVEKETQPGVYYLT